MRIHSFIFLLHSRVLADSAHFTSHPSNERVCNRDLPHWWRGDGFAITKSSAQFTSVQKAVSLKEQAWSASVFLKVPFRPCVSGCVRCLSSSGGHDCCFTCLGWEHAGMTFVDGSCPHCKKMTMSTLSSRLSFLVKARVPCDVTHAASAEPCTWLTLWETWGLQWECFCRASPHGPGVSCASKLPSDGVDTSHGGPSLSFGTPVKD